MLAQFTLTAYTNTSWLHNICWDQGSARGLPAYPSPCLSPSQSVPLVGTTLLLVTLRRVYVLVKLSLDRTTQLREKAAGSTDNDTYDT
jgi:hypothetical protein